MEGQIPRYLLVFTLLALSGFIVLIGKITSLEDLNDQLTSNFYKIQSSIHSAFKHPKILLPAKVNHPYCAQFGQEPTAEEAKEERDLLNSIAWPGPAVQGLPLEVSSDPAKSYFMIHGPPRQHIGGQLVVSVHMQNFLGLPKKHGGDFLIARLHSPELGAGVAGKVHDHQDGNYIVIFPLLWVGVVWVQITMVHSSEAVVVLKRLQEEKPDRGVFKSMFRAGAASETTVCNLCLPLNQDPLCNYTDILTGEPWYCYKPKTLGCDARVTHFKADMKGNLITNYDAQFFQSGINLKVPIHSSGMGNVTVIPAEEGQIQVKNNQTASGYYYKNTWRPLKGQDMHQFNNATAITKCLRGKVVYMFGDSTIRQWFEYLTAVVPNLKQGNLYIPKSAGPYVAVDSKNNIMISFRCHGPPIFFTTLFTSELRYVANELDRIEGGPNTVILVSIGAHFNMYPIDIYIRRLRHIRRALLQLLKREPTTLVVIRSANMRKLNLQISLSNSDWFSQQQDTVLRAMFHGLNIHILDAWEMTLAHNLPHDLHPPRPIVRNMIDLILSQICHFEKT
ncbi:NXPE family member 3-like isoform X1 [Silurus meridionalis]|uniref:NXPE family member 3-like isoform X1 n=1 Tax=Silurus meridionalis TaxID=175797 RepID=UPI001EE9E16C|nr:NXPE family member 3-like isoform X1 [Silurus meridionalis]